MSLALGCINDCQCSALYVARVSMPIADLLSRLSLAPSRRLDWYQVLVRSIRLTVSLRVLISACAHDREVVSEEHGQFLALTSTSTTVH